MADKKQPETTTCGATFEHDVHLTRTERGKIIVCDGTFRRNKL
jgi:hypothetical protein